MLQSDVNERELISVRTFLSASRLNLWKPPI
jgi:hypothetical protein